jgi:two-component system, OmpR family, response regulator
VIAVSRILVVDDEVRVATFVSRALSADGFFVDTAHDGERALTLARTRKYDLVVLDLRLPVVDGVSVLRKIMKDRPGQRVLVLSALSQPRVRVRCLELGAIDYLPKPFTLAEFLLRVRARIREAGSSHTASGYLHAGRISLDLRRLTANVGEGEVILSPREFRLLYYLMTNDGQVCTREELLAEVWGYSFDPGTNIVDAYVRRLRTKLGGDVVETVRNVGYAVELGQRSVDPLEA